MPYTNVEPELFVVHKGVCIFRAYDSDNMSDPLTFWFSTDILEEEDPFDVREIADELRRKGIKDVPEIHPTTDPDDNKIKKIISMGLDQGIIKPTNGGVLDRDIFIYQYINGQFCCPLCGKPDGIKGGSVETGNEANQEMSCDSCGRHWLDHYKLDHITLIE